MKLIEILSGIKFDSRNLNDLEIRGISIDSNRVQKDFIFIAVKGAHYDGHNFIYQAIERGACVVIVEENKLKEPLFSDNVVLIKVEDSKKIVHKIAANYYKHPSHYLDVIGITGTNGKTTVSFILEEIFKTAEISSGLIGTVCYKIGNREIPAFNTTPDAISIQKYIRETIDASGDVLLMEASSHGLYQGRLDGVAFDAAVFTNLGKDHLDYHLDMESYYQAKKILFTQLLKNEAFIVVNIDDEYGKRLLKEVDGEKISYGFSSNADVRIMEYDISIKGMQLKIKAFKEEFEIYTSIFGKHNIYNILAAIALALRFGVKKDYILNALENFTGVKGRLEHIFGSSQVKVFIDYAHTPEALKEVLFTLKNLKEGKLWVVFGCGGNRYKEKRSVMGVVAAELADKVVITSDNSRDENPAQIIDDIIKDIGDLKEKCCIIADRKEAIEKTIVRAEKGDLILIAGKGHERYQVIGNLIIPFDDKEVASRALVKRTMEEMANVV
ncbi:MAG: UDP-N-acetylmuramoyl-L-alanyl-D-glutamate--2,6-diaminopimelate ligase [Candidatus Saelkia tenebricola]|nr:UDP-N-acetylmuramoyl-L-alanyl-D-glutamate--2,6-diaminopimelate ligase [Candidatus Saelkia tenebricola]